MKLSYLWRGLPGHPIHPPLTDVTIGTYTFALIAAADYLFQYRQWFERQKMSVRELKDEFKQTNGNPQVKAKIRQIRQTRSRKRMMAAVPDASVVITNPTHFAVALKYERGMNAPICVAKGADLIARKIREVLAATPRATSATGPTPLPSNA